MIALRNRQMKTRSPPSTSREGVEVDDFDPLEIDGRWQQMDVKSSGESNSRLSRRSALLLAAALAMVTASLFVGHGSLGSDVDDERVAPIRGTAYLSRDEFKDVRTARAGESVLLTGGLGFIGSHVADLLLHRGFEVTIMDDESNGHNHNEFCQEMVPNNITVVDDFPSFPNTGGDTTQFTHVVHLAAAISVAESMANPVKYENINYGGSEKVINWISEYNKHAGSAGATKVRKLVAASSAAIYGDQPKLLPLQESAPYGGISPYADTKYRMEGLMKSFVEGQNNDGVAEPVSAVALRFFNVFGPRQDPHNPYSGGSIRRRTANCCSFPPTYSHFATQTSGVISLFLEAALTGKDITILGDGAMTRDFVFVKVRQCPVHPACSASSLTIRKDVARAIVLALLQDVKGDASFDVYNVCTGKSITINTLAGQVKQSMDSNSKITHLDPREGDIRESSCNPKGASDGILFKSAVSQEVGLEKTAAWFREDQGRRSRT